MTEPAWGSRRTEAYAADALPGVVQGFGVRRRPTRRPRCPQLASDPLLVGEQQVDPALQHCLLRPRGVLRHTSRRGAGWALGAAVIGDAPTKRFPEGFRM